MIRQNLMSTRSAKVDFGWLIMMGLIGSSRSVTVPGLIKNMLVNTPLSWQSSEHFIVPDETKIIPVKKKRR